MDSRHRLLAFVGLAVVLVVLWHYLERPQGSGFETRHLGTWTDPAGPPGNRLTFRLEWKDLPGAPMSVGEGIVTGKHWLGQAEFTASWGFEHGREPLRFNVTTRQHNYVVPAEFLPDGRLRLAFHENNDNAYGENALRGPAVKTLILVKDIGRPQVEK